MLTSFVTLVGRGRGKIVADLVDARS